MKADTKPTTENANKVKKMPLWNVIILDSPDHSFEYCLVLFVKVFGKSFDEAQKLTMEVHEQKRAIGATCSLERAQLYKQQVDAQGPDIMVKHCKNSIGCTLEPAE